MLDTQALTLLFNILSSGTPILNTACIPSPPHFAVAATCLVHPRTTTRAKSSEEKDAAAAALRLLRLTNSLFGPVATRLDAAFTFTHFESSRRGVLRRRVSDDAGASGDGGGVSHFGDETRPLNLDLGRSASLWSRAEDFWHAVGWAFNCSVSHPERWGVWRLWLEFMCEVLEDDWNERLKMAERSKSGTGDDGPLKQSLIFRYVDRGGSIGFGRNRRILRAIFADGASAAVAEFGQVFPKELESRRAGDSTNETTRRNDTAAVNIDAEQFGDYLSHDEDKETDSEDDNNNDSKPARKRPRRGTKNDATATSTSKDTLTTSPNADISRLGGLPSLALRQRLLSLLSCVSNRLPESFLSLDDLYHLFVENIRHLPLPIFQAFVSPSALSSFSPTQQITLCDHLLACMLESSAPRSRDAHLTQPKLEQCFLPFAASTASPVDNAKVSITLEALLVLLAGDDNDLVTATPGLRDAVGTGIVARVEKAGSSEPKKKGLSRDLDAERCWLLESGDRLRFLVDDVLGGGVSPK